MVTEEFATYLVGFSGTRFVLGENVRLDQCHLRNLDTLISATSTGLNLNLCQIGRRF